MHVQAVVYRLTCEGLVRRGGTWAPAQSNARAAARIADSQPGDGMSGTACRSASAAHWITRYARPKRCTPNPAPPGTNSSPRHKQEEDPPSPATRKDDGPRLAGQRACVSSQTAA